VKLVLTKSVRGPYHVLLCRDYDQDVYDAISSLPAAARWWDPALRAWKVADTHVDQAQALLDAIAEGRA
jgi:hypothetical protein